MLITVTQIDAENIKREDTVNQLLKHTGLATSNGRRSTANWNVAYAVDIVSYALKVFLVRQFGTYHQQIICEPFFPLRIAEQFR